MTADEKEMQLQEQEMISDETERTRDYRCFIPRADICEVDEDIFVILDMPGINENAIEITLEKDILTVKGYAQIYDAENYSLILSEYEEGDYERSFRISNAIDRDKIDATYNNGVLKLVLPKAEETKTKKIAVKAG
jgi:HSP20 family molecular chaperone IbpA